jgi:CRP-like cAMP-binding protein
MVELNLVEKVVALEGVELLENLAPDQLSRIAMIASEVRLPPGRTILEGARPDAMYIVVDGSVELSQAGKPLDTAGQNAVLGAWALFDESDSSPLAATTIEDTRLLRIARDDFYDLLADNSEMTSTILSTLVRRFRKLVEQ